MPERPAPPRSTVATALALFLQELPALACLNLVFLLTCLPLVTIGPALSALGFVTGELLCQNTVTPVRDYVTRLGKNLVKKLLYGLALMLAALVLCLSIWYYAKIGLLPLVGLSAAGLLCLLALAVHLLPALSEDIPPAHPLRQAAATALASLWRTLLWLLIALLVLLPQLVFFPMTLPLTCTVGLVLPALLLGLARALQSPAPQDNE